MFNNVLYILFIIVINKIVINKKLIIKNKHFLIFFIEMYEKKIVTFHFLQHFQIDHF